MRIKNSQKSLKSCIFIKTIYFKVTLDHKSNSKASSSHSSPSLTGHRGRRHLGRGVASFDSVRFGALYNVPTVVKWHSSRLPLPLFLFVFWCLYIIANQYKRNKVLGRNWQFGGRGHGLQTHCGQVSTFV